MFLHSGECLRLGRRLQALARDVEQPAMEGAAQAAVLQPAEGEVGAAMRAMPVDQAVAALLVAEQHQVFAEQVDRLDRARRPAARRPAPPAASTSASVCRRGPSGPVRVIRSFASWLIMAEFSGLSVQAEYRLESSY